MAETASSIEVTVVASEAGVQTYRSSVMVAGNPLTYTLSVTEPLPDPEPEKHPLLLGMTSAPKEHAAMMQRFPTIAYTAEFGPDGDDADALPELGSFNTGKYTELGDVPATLGVSWKDAPDQLDAWLTLYGQANKDPLYLHWWHEPHGDITSFAYRTSARVAVDILADHQYRHLVLGFGPVVTRYWLVEKQGDLADWWVDGMTHYGIDVYNDAMDRYRPPTEWGPIIRDFAAGKNASWGIREWGKKRITGDTTGAGRCEAIEADVTWCAQNWCRYMGWWNFGTSQPSSKVFGTGATAATYDAERRLFDRLFADYDPRGKSS